MAIDGTGTTTVLGSIGAINLPALHPSQMCQLASMTSGFENGYMARLDSAGSLQQLTYLQGSGTPLFSDISVRTTFGTIALWSVGNDESGSSTSALERLTIAALPEVQLVCLGNAASFSGGPLARAK